MCACVDSARHVAYPPVQGVVHASSMAPLLTGLLATCHVCSTRSTLPSPATLFQTSHPTPITQFEASWRGQDRVCRQHDVHLWPAWGGALARGPTGRAPCGPLRLALRVPGGRPPRGGSHQRRDAVACRTSPLVDIGRRHCACRG